MTEHLEVCTDCVSEYEKLKQNLVLSETERGNWREYEFYIKNPQFFKRCNKCGVIKHITEFYKHVLKKQGVFDYCKICARRLNVERKRLTKIHELM